MDAALWPEAAMEDMVDWLKKPGILLINHAGRWTVQAWCAGTASALISKGLAHTEDHRRRRPFSRLGSS